MKDGETIETFGVAHVKWCEACQSKYVEYPRLVALREKYGRVPLRRQCCRFNERSKCRKFLDKPWPLPRTLDEIFGTHSDYFEDHDEYYDRKR